MHLHHRLLQIGHSHRRVVLLIYLWVSIVAFGDSGPGAAAGEPMTGCDGDRAKRFRALAEQLPQVVGRIYPLELGPPVGWPVKYRVSGPDLTRVHTPDVRIDEDPQVVLPDGRTLRDFGGDLGRESLRPAIGDRGEQKGDKKSVFLWVDEAGLSPVPRARHRMI